MSPRDWDLRIDDNIDALQAIASYIDGITYDQWTNDRKTIDAVIRNIEIIGEAANHIPEDIQIRYADIPWAQMRSIRNLLIHEYFGVDIDIIWQTITDDLPDLSKKKPPNFFLWPGSHALRGNQTGSTSKKDKPFSTH